MTTESPIAVVLKFEELINSRNVDAIISLVTEDSAFMDSLGNQIEGTDRLRKAWQGYFQMVPDYTITHSEIFAQQDTVAMFGTAQGTFSHDKQIKKDDFWKTPAAWKAIVKNGKIALWQVYADNEPIRQIMRKYQTG